MLHLPLSFFGSYTQETRLMLDAYAGFLDRLKRRAVFRTPFSACRKSRNASDFVQEPRRVPSSADDGRKSNLFFPGTCASEKTLLSLQACESGPQTKPSGAGLFGRGGARKRSDAWPSGQDERCGLCPDEVRRSRLQPFEHVLARAREPVDFVDRLSGPRNPWDRFSFSKNLHETASVSRQRRGARGGGGPPRMRSQRGEPLSDSLTAPGVPGAVRLLCL